MNMHELPMIIFTVVAQMCVGAFIILGGLQLWLGARTDDKTADRLTVPVLYVIGPLLIFGLIASMFHMNDITNTINVIRNWDSSWLSREILFGVAFAGVGFLFSLMQWFRIGSQTVRTIVAIIAAIFGVGLVWSMSMIYASLPTVPAWNTWVVPVQFFATALMLGAALIAAANLITSTIRSNNTTRTHTTTGATTTGATAAADGESVVVNADGSTRATGTKSTEAGSSAGGSVLTKLRIKETKDEINAPMRDEEWTMTRKIVQAMAILAAVAGVVIMISYIFHMQDLATGNPVAQQSATVFAGGFFTTRLVLLGVGSVLLGFLVYRAAGSAVRDNPQPLMWITIISFLILLASELMGRSLHYDSMLRIGM